MTNGGSSRTCRSQIRNAPRVVPAFVPRARLEDIGPASALESSFGTVLVILVAAVKILRFSPVPRRDSLSDRKADRGEKRRGRRSRGRESGRVAAPEEGHGGKAEVEWGGEEGQEKRRRAPSSCLRFVTSSPPRAAGERRSAPFRPPVSPRRGQQIACQLNHNRDSGIAR